MNQNLSALAPFATKTSNKRSSAYLPALLPNPAVRVVKCHCIVNLLKIFLEKVMHNLFKDYLIIILKQKPSS